MELNFSVSSRVVADYPSLNVSIDGRNALYA